MSAKVQSSNYSDTNAQKKQNRAKTKSASEMCQCTYRNSSMQKPGQMSILIVSLRFAIFLFFFSNFLTTGFEHMLSFRHLMRGYIYTHNCQMLCSFLVSERASQV